MYYELQPFQLMHYTVLNWDSMSGLLFLKKISFLYVWYVSEILPKKTCPKVIFRKSTLHYLYINLACLSVRLYPINVKTAQPIGPKFFVGHHETPGKVYG